MNINLVKVKSQQTEHSSTQSRNSLYQTYYIFIFQFVFSYLKHNIFSTIICKRFLLNFNYPNQIGFNQEIIDKTKEALFKNRKIVFSSENYSTKMNQNGICFLLLQLLKIKMIKANEKVSVIKALKKMTVKDQTENNRRLNQICRAENKTEDAIKQSWWEPGSIQFICNTNHTSIESCKRAIQSNPSDDSAYNDLGVYYQNIREVDHAIECFKRAIQIKPNFYAYMNLGNTYKQGNKIDQAIRSYKSAIQINLKNYPKDFKSLAFFNLGNAYQAAGKTDEAIGAYKSSIQINPREQAYIYLGNAYQAINRFNLSQDCFKQAQKLNPKNHQIFFNLGITYQATNRTEEAIKCYKNAILIKPEYYKSFKFYNNLGLLYQQINKLDDSINSYKQAIQLNPNIQSAYNNLGNAYHKQKYLKQSLECFEKAIELLPDNPLSIINKISVLYQTGKQNQAFQLFSDLSNNLDIHNKQTLEKLKSNPYNLSEQNLFYINTKLQEFHDLKQIAKQEAVFTSQDNQILGQASRIVFGSLKQTQQQNDIKMLKKNQQKDAVQIKKLWQQIQKLKKFTGIEIQQKFKKLLIQFPDKKDYFVELVYRLWISIRSYQNLETGMFDRGDEPIKTKFASVLSYFQSGVSLAEKLSLVQSVASIINGVCQFYLGMESQFVTQAIVSKFKSFDEKQIKAKLKEMVLFLSKSEQFPKLFQKSKQQGQLCWFEKIRLKYEGASKEVNQFKNDMLAKVTNVQKTNFSENINLAREHSVQLLTILIQEENRARIDVSQEDFLIEVATIFLEEQAGNPNPIKKQQAMQNTPSQITKNYEAESKQCSIM